MCVMAAVTYSINQTTHKPRCGVRFTLEGKRPYGSGEQIKWEPSLLGNPSCQFWEIQSEAWPGDYYHLPRTVKEGIGRLHLMTTQTTRYRCNQNHFKSRIANHQQHDINRLHSKKWLHCSPALLNQILQQLAFQDCYVDCLEAKEYWKKIEGDGDDDNGDGPDHGCPLD